MNMSLLGHSVLRVTGSDRVERFYGGVLGPPLWARFHKEGGFKMAATAARLFRILAVCVPVLMFTNAPAAEHEPSKAAKGMPGAKGTIEYKPTDWAGNVTTYWKDSDGVNPGVAGCHVGVTQDGKPNGRFFGEACQSAAILIESNPGAGVVHSHANDLGHPDTFDCKAWCVGVKKAKGGVCKTASAPSPCTASARCECD